MKTQNILIPVQRFKRERGFFHVPDAPVLASSRAADRYPLEQLADELKQVGVKRPGLALDAASDAAIRIHRDAAIKQPQGYRITIDKTGVRVLASTDAGAFYAVQTLRDLVALHGAKLPAGRIDDHPDFARRGIYHDTARGKVPTVETVKGLVERLARFKINELQLYIENNFTFANHPDIGRGFDGYTPADLHEIEAHCAKHHMKFVGSLTSFGHMELILKEPAYQHLGEYPGYFDYPGGTTLCPIDPGSAKLVREMYDEFLPLFDATDFNACGDEPWELGKGRSQERAAKVGEGRLYVDFMTKIYDVCQSHGKRVNVWADIVLKHPELLGDWPDDTVMLNWAYNNDSPRIEQTKMIADAGLPIVVCPGTNGWVSHGTRMPMAVANVSKFVSVGRKYDAVGVLHTDWGDCGHRNTLGVSMFSFAHAAAHAWNGRAVDDERFAKVFCRTLYGQSDDKLADSLVQLGNICDVAGSYSGLYQALRANLATKRRKKLWRVDHHRSADEPFFDHDPKRLQKGMDLAESLMTAKAWPKLPRGADAFDQLTRDEYMLAARQDYVAAMRTQLGTAYRNGEAVTPAKWKQLDRELAKLGERFDELWLARNRRSRLGENQAILNHARREAQRLAK